MTDERQAGAGEAVILHPSVPRRLTGWLLPAAALLVLILTAVFTFTAEAPAEELTRSGIWRIVCCAVIIAISVYFQFLNRVTFILTPHKVMQKGGWELLYENIASVTVRKSFLSGRIELVPKGAPEACFYISAYDCHLPIEKAADIIKNRCSSVTQKAKG